MLDSLLPTYLSCFVPKNFQKYKEKSILATFLSAHDAMYMHESKEFLIAANLGKQNKCL